MNTRSIDIRPPGPQGVAIPPTGAGTGDAPAKPRGGQRVELTIDRAAATFDLRPLEDLQQHGADLRRVDVDIGRARRAAATDPELIHALEALLERFPSVTRASELLITLHAVHHDLPAAVRCANRAMAQDPDNSRLLAGLGSLLLSQENGRDAIPILVKAAGMSHGEPMPSYLLAQAYRMAGRLDLAHETALRTVQLPAGEGPAVDEAVQALAGARNILGLLALERGKPAEAKGHLEAGLALDPKSELLQENLAWVQEEADSAYCRKMTAAYEALERDLDDLPSRRTIAGGLVAREMPRLALPYIDGILQRRPADGQALSLLFQACHAMGEADRGVRALRQAVAAGEDSEDPSIRFHLGSALFDLGLERKEDSLVTEALEHLAWYADAGKGHPTYGEFGLLADNIARAIRAGHITELIRAPGRPAPMAAAPAPGGPAPGPDRGPTT